LATVFLLVLVVTTPEIDQVLTQRSHCVIFGGNPVCTTGDHAVLKVLDKEKRQEHYAVVGAHLISSLKELQDKYEIIEDVRGRGLMVGVELVTDRTSKTPARGETSLAFER
jgi:alanine-glyoxylate transaminase/(R)-3-amino-2-methylpropionate-pyruvate transaminase